MLSIAEFLRKVLWKRLWFLKRKKTVGCKIWAEKKWGWRSMEGY